MFSSVKVIPHLLEFKSPILTSRNSMTSHQVWYVIIEDGDRIGIGECAPLAGLSRDNITELKNTLLGLEDHKEIDIARYDHLPSLRFAIEQAMIDLSTPKEFSYFNTKWSQGQTSLPINGLIWMGDEEMILRQIRQKLSEGWACLKMKIGALDWEFELRVLKSIRSEHPKSELEIRVDANGAFDSTNVESRLADLARLNIHSIEQPIKDGQWTHMESICKANILPIALDEELIPIERIEMKKDLLDLINPDYIILKPTLLGGFEKSQEWISLANERNIGWWVTSALESNVGLNALAQWTSTLEIGHFYQGLGTGALYSNNILSPLTQSKGQLRYDTDKKWSFDHISIE